MGSLVANRPLLNPEPNTSRGRKGLGRSLRRDSAATLPVDPSRIGQMATHRWAAHLAVHRLLSDKKSLQSRKSFKSQQIVQFVQIRISGHRLRRIARGPEQAADLQLPQAVALFPPPVRAARRMLSEAVICKPARRLGASRLVRHRQITENGRGVRATGTGSKADSADGHAARHRRFEPCTREGYGRQPRQRAVCSLLRRQRRLLFTTEK